MSLLITNGHIVTADREFDEDVSIEGEKIAAFSGTTSVIDFARQAKREGMMHAVEEIARARSEGYTVYGETCPQYLFLSADELKRPDCEGAKYVLIPPLRPKENQEGSGR